MPRYHPLREKTSTINGARQQRPDGYWKGSGGGVLGRSSRSESLRPAAAALPGLSPASLGRGGTSRLETGAALRAAAPSAAGGTNGRHPDVRAGRRAGGRRRWEAGGAAAGEQAGGRAGAPGPHRPPESGASAEPAPAILPAHGHRHLQSERLARPPRPHPFAAPPCPSAQPVPASLRAPRLLDASVRKPAVPGIITGSVSPVVHRRSILSAALDSIGVNIYSIRTERLTSLLFDLGVRERQWSQGV